MIDSTYIEHPIELDPVVFTEREYSHAYEEYREGLIIRDTHRLLSAAEAMKIYRLPFADNMSGFANTLEQCVETDPFDKDRDYRPLACAALALCIRSNVVTGVAVDAEAIVDAAQYFDCDANWLQKAASIDERSEVLLRSRGFSDEAIAEARWYSRRALHRLGVGSMVTRIASRLYL